MANKYKYFHMHPCYNLLQTVTRMKSIPLLILLHSSQEVIKINALFLERRYVMKNLLTKLSMIFIMSLLMIHFHQTLVTTKQLYNLMQTAVYQTQNVPPILF